jgi:hypothetical protein
MEMGMHVYIYVVVTVVLYCMKISCVCVCVCVTQCVDKVVCVMNLKGLSYRVDTEALRAFRINLQIDTDYYPERLKYLYMINAPCEYSSIVVQ